MGTEGCPWDALGECGRGRRRRLSQGCQGRTGVEARWVGHSGNEGTELPYISNSSIESTFLGAQIFSFVHCLARILPDFPIRPNFVAHEVPAATALVVFVSNVERNGAWRMLRGKRKAVRSNGTSHL